VSDTLEVIDLDSLLSDEPGCEVKHIRTVCSVHVAYKLRWCAGDILACAGCVEHPAYGTFEKMRTSRRPCGGGCGRTPGECWKVWPI
jgi:hypothetical protein